MDIKLSSADLGNLLARGTEYGVKRSLEASNKLSPGISLSEAYQLSSRREVDRAVKSGTFRPVKKGGVTSRIYFIYADFDQWLMKNEICKWVGMDFLEHAY